MIRRIVGKIEHPLIYKPNLSSWTGKNLYNQQELTLTNSKNEKIHFRYKKLNDEYLILFSHGNAANISGLEARYAFLEDLGFSYLTYDYPGYGLSEGVPSEKGLYESINLVAEYACSHLSYSLEKIVMFGQSLGGAVAVDYSYRNKVHCAIIESSFQSTHEMSKLIFRGFPLHLLAENKFRSIDKIDSLKCPVLFIHGDSDNTIPIVHTKKLYEKSSSPKDLYIINDCDHANQIQVGGKEYRNRILNFIRSARD